MPYLNLDINYLTNVKTRRLACLLGPGSEMLPIRLWCHCASHHPEDGVLEGYTVEEIEFFLEWKGARGRAVAALIKVGFLNPLEHGFRVHNWIIHEGHISEFKRRSRIANASRWKDSIALAEARSRPILKNPAEECEFGSMCSSDAMNSHPGETMSTGADEAVTPSETPSGEPRNPSITSSDKTRILSNTPPSETGTSTRTPCNETRTPSDETRTPSSTPCNETRTPSRTPSSTLRDETWSPPTKPTNTHTTDPSVFTYLNLSNQTTQRQGGELCVDEPVRDRIKDGIRETIFQRMGPDADLSEVDVETMVALSKIHGLAFQKACEHLRPGVKNIVGYIRSLLDLPKGAAFRSASPRILSS